jgi:hypothetical protein
MEPIKNTDLKDSKFGAGVRGWAQFTSLNLQEKVDKLSHRARSQHDDGVMDGRVVSNSITMAASQYMLWDSAAVRGRRFQILVQSLT